MDPKERDGSRKVGQILVTCARILGTIPLSTIKRMEEDPWTAVEPVPCLCAVSLNPSCEHFSDPKRMSRGAHTKLRSLGVQGISLT